MAKTVKQSQLGGETARRRGLSLRAIALAVLGVTVVWLAMYGLVRAYQYVEDDPGFCRSCHTMRQAWDQWQHGDHQGITCHSCHETDMVGSLRQVWLYITQQPDAVEAHANVPAAACLSCHRPEEGAAASAATPDAHHAAGERIDCPVCHGQELHHFQTTPWSDICASCHG